MNDHEMEERINQTLAKPLLEPELVICACQKLSQRLLSGDYDTPIQRAGLEAAALMLSREVLERKMKTELGLDVGNPNRYPLGVLFHIGAGNLDGLSAFSVVEGLLAGNINILKLPEAERGISRQLLRELVGIEPALKEYIYVFDVPSADIKMMKRLADMADAVVLWGGDEAVSAVRRLADPTTALIEWGHKISFAYVTEAGMTDEPLTGLALHMLETRQLLCSSCQGIYLDTDKEALIEGFCSRFLPLLEQAAEQTGGFDIGITAQNTLRVYHARLEAACFSQDKVYRGRRVSIISSQDPGLTASMMFGNCWVKSLPKDRILSVLRKKKGYLQTVGLLCSEEERPELSRLLLRAGAVKIRSGRDMSQSFCGEAHDGEYPLRRYSKIVV